MLWQVYSFLELQIVLDDKTLHDGLGVKSSSKTSLKTRLLAVARKMNPRAVPQETKRPPKVSSCRSQIAFRKKKYSRKIAIIERSCVIRFYQYISQTKTFQKDFIFPQPCHFIEDLFKKKPTLNYG